MRDIHEGATEADDPGKAARDILAGLDQGDVFAVRAFADEIARAMAYERVVRDGDMARVLAFQSALLEAAIDWLPQHGLDCSALRTTTQLPKERTTSPWGGHYRQED